jgi:hypothetical protein
MTIEFVDSVAGSLKTRSAVSLAVTAARRRGVRTIFAMPTLALVKEMIEYARSFEGGTPIIEITSRRRNDGPVEPRILNHIAKRTQGCLLFITHAGFDLVTDLPPEASGFEIYLDEVLDVILARKPFKLRDSHWVLTSWLDTVPVPTTIAERNRLKSGPPEFTYPKPGSNKKTDLDRLETCEKIVQPESNASKAERDMAAKEGIRLLAKQRRWEEWRNRNIMGSADNVAFDYLWVIPKTSPTQDPWYGLKRKDFAKEVDDIHKYLEPLPRWFRQNNALFTEMAAWNRTTIKSNDPKIRNDYRRGLITITGFRRPDLLKSFGKVTVMSALFRYTMMYAVWQTLGVKFVPSQDIPLAEMVTKLGKRKLKIYWLTDEGWSKSVRDHRSGVGGISNILKLIKDSGVINPKKKVCVQINKDDEKDPKTVSAVFKNAIVLPHNIRGLNTWIKQHQMIHCAALNSYTSDIRWMESVLDIDSRAQRIGRTGQEIYQALMRLSLRNPKSRSDITLVVMDKDIAEWLPQWFSPINQVEVLEIDSSGVITKKGKPGPKPIGDKTLTNAERQRRYRLKHSAPA